MTRGKYARPTLFQVNAALALAIMVVGLVSLDVSSEAEPSWMEQSLASTFLDMKIRQKGPARSSPLKSLNEDIVIGSEIYRAQCSFCHGGIDGNAAPLAKSFSPRPPQFVINPTRRPAWMNAYVIRHGIRWTAMPAFPDLSEVNAWRIAMFLETRARPKEQQ